MRPRPSRASRSEPPGSPSSPAASSPAVDIARLTTEDRTSDHPSADIHPPIYMPGALPPLIREFGTLVAGYDVVLSDVWGVVPKGVAATQEACDARVRFRSDGGTVVLITNAPRPGEVVARFTLDRLGVPRAAYDGIISSGDVTPALIAPRARQR